ncbi:MAG: YHYH protein [Gemmatimonadaceae bacterium]|nr:YHYH protein [Gemmatimonadaceae bacterium]
MRARRRRRQPSRWRPTSAVENTAGENIAFLDACNGHPTPMGSYHYHALPPCVTAMVDTAGGPSHIIGVAFDGYLIYGDRDISGRQITSSQLDQCSGITSATWSFRKACITTCCWGTRMPHRPFAVSPDR